MFLTKVNLAWFLAVVASFDRATEAVDWEYSEVDRWADTFPNCAGQKQSPVNIKTNQVKVGFIDPIQFHNYDVVPVTQTVTNDGHTIKVEITSTTERPFIASGGPWFYQKKRFNFAQYHFHWGSANSQGSEHTINSIRYPMEVHLVHYNARYSDIGTAVTQSDGLAVLGIFFEISGTDNPALAPLISAMGDVTIYNADAGDSVAKDNLYALASLLPSNTRRFYRYKGSLTTPTCDESVLWTVFEEPIKISQAQMDVFRTVIGTADKSSSDNYRPIQPLNNRKMEKSWK